MSGEFTYSASIRFKHPKRDTTLFDKIVGKQPGRRWRVGEQRSTPKGNPLTGVYRESYCFYKIGKGDREDLCACLRKMNRRLARHKRRLAAWRKHGGTIMYYVFCVSESGGVFGAVFPPHLLTQLGSLGIELGLEVYPPRRQQRRGEEAGVRP
ncbi:MAG: hypothetical protein JNK82_45300 [Myxococcaceae bacterium]|nr:hypothetical protein [Myxococcaceae bacterium]